jgi:hypothetical protein
LLFYRHPALPAQNAYAFRSGQVSSHLRSC